ncbi:MAG TPA: DUF4386 domain-containing protein [Gemmatimonadales bacterium]|nr:DUF4386 domain-containing protein [Gemmatimonadales bacterium]
MRAVRNPGRVVGLWYLLLVFAGPLRLMYIPRKLFVEGNASATTANIATHEWLFRSGMLSEVIGSVVLIFLALAFYRLFKDVDQYLAVLLVITGGIMPAVFTLLHVAIDGTVLGVAQADGAYFAALDQPHRDALAMLFLRFNHYEVVSAELLWGVWLFPMGALTYKSGFLPRFLGVWLIINGFAYVVLCVTGILFPANEDKVFLYSQPALFGELAIMLWLLIKGATPTPARVEPAFAG